MVTQPRKFVRVAMSMTTTTGSSRPRGSTTDMQSRCNGVNQLGVAVARRPPSSSVLGRLLINMMMMLSKRPASSPYSSTLLVLVATLLSILVSYSSAAVLPSASSSSRLSSSSSNSNRWFTPSSASFLQRHRSPLQAMAGARRGNYHVRSGRCAAQLGGGVVGETFFGGLHNFLSIYNIVLTGRILLSWFPQVARQPVFEPLFVVTNPFFNIFRGLIPPIAGLDLSPLPAFFLLSFLTNATETMGAELAPNGPGHRTLNSRMIATWRDVMKNKQNLRLPRLPSFPAPLPSLGARRS
ncbi:Hypothetical protein NocV09_04400180 [Nannochloropsis oceanica]